MAEEKKGSEKIELEQIANIARLKLTDEEKQKLGKDIDGILGSFSEINAIAGLDKIEETGYVNEEKNPLREDGTEKYEGSDTLVGLFTRKEGRLLVAPKSLE